MTVRIYNTLTRCVQEFQPLHPPAVTMYVCGPTVYDAPHIGHARSAYIFDVWRRYLEFKFPDHRVTFVRNVTDVDDKIIDKARQELAASGAPPAAGALKAKCAEVAARYLQRYHETMDRLGIRRPDIEPKATEHVVPDPAHVEATKHIDASMTGFISQLITKNAAYPAGGDVYFSVRKFPGYGALSNRTVDELQAGARVEPGERKADPLDFALWKAAKPDEPSWNSPWGPGRPGWHIECSVMSTAYLGDAFDIHGGGVDLVFPHHENELAQAQAIGKPFARYWIHNGLLTVNGEKMSKSLGNFVTVEDALKQCGGQSDVLKEFFLNAHYRSPLNYSDTMIQMSLKRLNGWRTLIQHMDELERNELVSRKTVTSTPPPKELSNLETRFEKAMDDDLNTPEALAVLDEIVHEAWGTLRQQDPSGLPQPIQYKKSHETFNRVMHAELMLRRLASVLGLFEQHEALVLSPEQQAKIDEREDARKRKDFKTADRIRQEFHAIGLILEDTDHGPILRRRL